MINSSTQKPWASTGVMLGHARPSLGYGVALMSGPRSGVRTLRATKRPTDRRRQTATGSMPGRARDVLGPWYESGQVMRPWTVRLKMHTCGQRVPKMSGNRRRTAHTGAALARPAHRPARWGRSWSGRVHVGRRGKGPCEAARTDDGSSPDRRPMDLPATKAQRSARAYHRCAAVITGHVPQTATRRSLPRCSLLQPATIIT